MLLLFWYCLKTCAPPTASRVSHWFLSAIRLSYYDIFIRHGVSGTYFDIVKEVSHSPMMAQYLTYINSRSYAKR
jgi:hypothetical protein